MNFTLYKNKVLKYFTLIKILRNSLNPKLNGMMNVILTLPLLMY